MPKKTELPSITHVQFAVLSMLADGDKPGREIREELAKLGTKKSGPRFYHFMSQMESAGHVAGRYEDSEISGVSLRLRWFSLTPDGKWAMNDAAEFYRRKIGWLDHVLV